MAPFTEKSTNPPKFKRIKSAIDTPVETLPKSGEPNELYVAEDGTDIRFWDNRNQRFKSTQQKGGDRFLLSTENTEGYFEFDDNFNQDTISNRIQGNSNGLTMSGVPADKRLQDYLRAYFKLNDSSGSSISDSFGGYAPSVSTGSNITSVSDGKVNTAVQLAEDTSIDAGTALDVKDNDFTIAFWFKPTDSTLDATEQILSTGSTNHFTIEYTTNKKIQVSGSDGTNSLTAFTSSNALNTNTWSHVAVTRTGTTFTLYIDGVQSTASTASSIGVVSESSNEVIGASNGASDGLNSRMLDELGVWLTSLGSSYITQLVNPSSPGYYTRVQDANTTDLVSYYTFDYPSNPYTDSQGNNTGTANGGMSTVDGQVGKALSLLPHAGISLNVQSAFNVSASTAFTIALWIKIQTEAAKPILTCGSGANSLTLSTTNADDASDSIVGIQLELKDDSDSSNTVSTPEDMSTGAWHHVAFGRDSSNNGFIRIDGGDITESSADSLGPDAVSGTSYIGANGASNVDALLDEVAIWTGTKLSDSLLDRFFTDVYQGNELFLSYRNFGSQLNAHYSLDGDTSDEKGNYSGSSFNGRFTQGKVGQAAEFSDPSQYIHTGEAFNVDSQDFTASFWVNFSDLSTEQYLIDADNGTSGWSLRLTSGGELQFDTTKSSSTTNKTTSISGGLSTDTWYFIAVARRNTEADLYVYDSSGSSPVYSTTFTGLASGSLSNGSGNTTIAHNGTGMVGGGKMDNVGIFKRSLNQSLIEILVNGGDGLPFSQMEQWNFLRSSKGLRMNAFAQVEDSYLQYEQDMSGFENYTVSTWVKPQTYFEDNNPTYFVWIGDDSQMDSPQAKNGYIAYDHLNKKIEINGNNTTHTVDFELQKDYWYHLVLVRKSGSYLSLYIEGDEVLTSTDITGVSSGKVLRIGGGPINTSGNILGTSDSLVDQVTVFQQALSQKFIDILYNKGLGMDIGTEVKKLASASDVGSSSGGGGGSGDKLLRYLHSYYSFDHQYDPHTRDLVSSVNDWQRDDAGDYDAELVSDNSRYFATVSSAKLGVQALLAPGDSSGTQEFKIGTGDPTADISTANVALNTRTFSLSFWFQTPNTSTGGDMTLYRSHTDQDSTSLFVIQNGSTLKLQKGTNSPIFTSTGFIKQDEWHHIVITYSKSNSEFKLFVDGTLNKKSSVSASYSYHGSRGAIVDDTSTSIAFKIDEFGTWEEYALTESEVSTLYNSSNGNNDFIYQLWHYYPAQQDINLKDHNLEHVREPRKSHHAATKGHAYAGDYILYNAHAYYNFEDNRDKIKSYDFQNSNNVSISSGSGKIDNAVQYTGGSSDLGDALHALSVNDFSISFHAKLTDLDSDQILVTSNSGTGTTNGYFQLKFNSSNNRLIFDSDWYNPTNDTVTSNSSVETGDDVITDSNFHHIVVVRQGSGPPEKSAGVVMPGMNTSLYIYVDGLLAVDDTIQHGSLTTIDASDPDYGSQGGLEPWQTAPPSRISHDSTPIVSGGGISEFGVWLRQLDTSEILYLNNDSNAINEFIYMIWSAFSAHSDVDLNGNRIKNVAAPQNDTDAVRLTDLTKWRSGNLDVRQTVAHSLLNIDGKGNMLAKTPDPTAISTAQHTNSLGEKLRSLIDFNDFSDGDKSVKDQHQDNTASVDDSNGSNTSISTNFEGTGIELVAGNSIDLGDRLELEDKEFTINFWVKFPSDPSGNGNIILLTDDSNHSGDLSSTNGIRFYYDSANSEYILDVNKGDASSSFVKVAPFTISATDWNWFTIQRTNGSNTSIKVYVNAIFDDEITFSDSSATITSSGNNNGLLQTTGVNAQFNQLGIWEKPLDKESRIALGYNTLNMKNTVLVEFDGSITNQGSDGASAITPGFDGTPAYVTDGGVRGDALYKQDADDRFSLQSGSGLVVATEAMTLGMWFYVSTENQTKTLAYTEFGISSLTIEQVGKEVRLSGGGNSTISTSEPVSASTWFHVLVRSEGTPGDMELFVNGKSAGTIPVMNYADSTATTQYLRIMEDMAGDNSERLDLLTVWRRELADMEINQLYNNGNALSAQQISGGNDLVASYPTGFTVPTTSNFVQHFTFGDGFEDGTQLNVGVSTSNYLTWTPSSTSDDTTYYLYVEYDESSDTLTTGTSTLAPQYSFKRPKNPSSGQFWYPVDHRTRGEEYDGSAWVSKLRLYVGEATTDGSGNFTRDAIHTYAYQGRYVSAPVQGQNADSYITFTHNIGTKLVSPLFIAQYLTDDEDYVTGDEIILNGTHNASYATFNKNNRRESILAYQKEGLANFTKANGDGTATNTKWDELQISLYATRLF